MLPLLEEVRLTNQERLPGWAETLDAVMRATAAWAPQDAGSVSPRLPIDAEHPLPFEDLLLPAILVARSGLLNQLGCRPADVPLALLSEEAYLALERNLLQKLTGRCARTLEAEFSCRKKTWSDFWILSGRPQRYKRSSTRRRTTRAS